MNIHLLLFVLALEPLTKSTRCHPDIHGYNTECTVNKICLYVDDILLYVSQPQTTIPPILTVIGLFGTFSGYRVNWSKSRLVSIRLEDYDRFKSLPFKVTVKKLQTMNTFKNYKYSSLFKANFLPLLDQLKNNIQFLLLGRVNTIKMLFFPQLLYLLQSIPTFLNKSFLKKLDSIILHVVWNYKSHRIKKEHLCKYRSHGRLALPNIIYYYWATGISSISS